MKKMNNKGFAITTLLYGLMSVAFLIMTLLMGIMSQNRQNTSTLVDKIEEELNRYGETETTFGFLGESQEYIVPHDQAGWYKVELWGAQTDAGPGDYVSGLIYLETNSMLYFFLGEQCGSGAAACSSAFNNGNTDVRLENALWTDASSQRTTIMKAAGNNGTSFISGYAGSNMVNSSGGATGQTARDGDIYFINGLHIPDANTGPGKANIELVSKNDASTVPNMKSGKLQSVRYIQDCTAGSTANTGNHLVEIQAIEASTGKNLAKGKTISGASSGAGSATDGVISTSYATLSSTCATLDLGANYTLSEVAVWHYYSDGRAYKNHTLSVKSSSESSYTVIKDTAAVTQYSEKESIVGYHYTPWQIEPTETIPTGNYYIISAMQNNASLTSANARNTSQPNVTTQNFFASRLQKWTVEPVDINTTGLSQTIKSAYAGKQLYKIFESENKHALQVQNVAAESTGSGENIEIYKWIAEKGTNVNAAKQYSGGGAWELWEIVPLGNGTYHIKSVVDASDGSGKLLLAHESESAMSNVVVNTTSQDAFTRRWKFINAEY